MESYPQEADHPQDDGAQAEEPQVQQEEYKDIVLSQVQQTPAPTYQEIAKKIEA